MRPNDRARSSPRVAPVNRCLLARDDYNNDRSNFFVPSLAAGFFRPTPLPSAIMSHDPLPLTDQLYCLVAKSIICAVKTRSTPPCGVHFLMSLLRAAHNGVKDDSRGDWNPCRAA